MNRYTDTELLELSNLIASVFYLDQKTDRPEEIHDKLIALTGVLQSLTQNEFTLFQSWFKQIVIQRFPKKQRKKMKQTIDKANRKEVNLMISNLGEDLERFYKEAQKKGIEKGYKEKAIKVAKSLLEKDISADFIAEVTELSIEEVVKLKREQTL